MLAPVKTILVVDDERNIVELVRLYLEQAGFSVVEARDGQAALEQHDRVDPDLIVLDLMLPKLDGMEVTREVRRRGETPILMLTARSDDIDRIVGLEVGADDYLSKPFNPRELVARIRAVLRRGRQSAGGSAAVTVGDLRLDPGARRVQRGGETIEVTGTEYSLLEALARDAGKVVKRDVLYREVLGRRPVPYDRSLDVHVSNLRRKLGPLPDGGERIKSVRGVGYQYVRTEG
jgi:two-component system response regulator CpxR